MNEFYLSRVIVPNPKNSNRPPHPYSIHQLFWQAFPGLPEGTPQPFMFRAEADFPVREPELRELEKDHTLYFVQSLQRPEWGRVQNLAHAEPRCITCEFRSGQEFYFRLRASPVRAFKNKPNGIDIKNLPPVKRGKNGKLNGGKWPVRGDAEIRKWFQNKMQRCGFETQFYEFVENKTAFRHKDDKKRDKVSHSSYLEVPKFTDEKTGNGRCKAQVADVLFDGLLQVRDAETFTQAVLHGVGGKKSLGFGLLSIRA